MCGCPSERFTENDFTPDVLLQVIGIFFYTWKVTQFEFLHKYQFFVELVSQQNWERSGMKNCNSAKINFASRGKSLKVSSDAEPNRIR